MQVRSPVLTYWRGRVFDTFDGSSWSVDPTSSFTSRARSARRAYRPLDSSGRRRPLYSQTYFLRQDAPDNTVFIGYSPWATSAPSRASGVADLKSGTVYRVVSVLPDFSGVALDRADARARVDFRYHDASGATDGLGRVAREIVTGAFSDLQRVQRILNYLDGNYAFDGGADDQLALSTTPIEFLQGGSSGTSMDFATATVLLSREVGVPARLTTGYLPGTFDPLSGTYVVRRGDRHTWAEVYLGRVGWVPFDAAPRSEAEAFGEGGSFRSASVNRLFNAGWGDEIHDYLRSSPNRVNEVVTGALEEGVPAVLALALAGSLATGVFIVWKLGLRPRWARRRLTYARLDGDGREQMLRIYRAAERLLRRAGLAARRPGQTLAEYAAQAGALLRKPTPDLVWLGQAAWAAAYDPGPYDIAVLPEAEARLRRLRVDLTGRG